MSKDKGRAVNRIYISGPITSIGVSRAREVFYATRDDLKRRGFDAVTPFENGVDEAAPYEDHMKADIELLKTCDTICLLPGWWHSEGAKREKAVAESIGMTVITYRKLKR